MTVTPADATATEALTAGVRGRVIEAGDPAYDAARLVVFGEYDGRPAAIVRVADAADIVHVIGWARERGVELAVRSGGHSGAGHSTTDGGVVIDVRDLDRIEIDPEEHTAWVGSGATAAAVSEALTEHDLAIGFGDTGSVGVGGITLGGGVGYLARKHGLTIDSLLEAELVTADGQVLRVSETNHPDLFWAIRGGGGNFGVATKFKFRLHPVGRMVGGMLVLPATADTVAGFIAAAEAAPDELTTIANVMSAPPMPFLPESVHGSVVILGMLAWAGDVAAGDEALAPFRALATPLADFVAPIRYPELFPPEDPEYRPTAVARTLFVDRVDRDLAATIVERLNASDASVRVAQLRVLGGAVARVPADATAYAHRDHRIMANVAAFYDGPDDRPVREAWVIELAATLAGGQPGAYVNFLGDDGEARIAEAYPGATWERLREIKRRYDPTNVFRRNQNIPAADGASR